MGHDRHSHGDNDVLKMTLLSRANHAGLLFSVHLIFRSQNINSSYHWDGACVEDGGQSRERVGWGQLLERLWGESQEKSGEIRH